MLVAAALAARAGVYAPIAEHVDDVVAGTLTTAQHDGGFIARDTKAERTDAPAPPPGRRDVVATS